MFVRAIVVLLCLACEYGWYYHGCFAGFNGSGYPLHGKYSYMEPYQGIQESTMLGWGGAAGFTEWYYWYGEYQALRPMSVERCLNFCTGHRYAGLLGGLGCMCGDAMEFETPLSDFNCNVPCIPRDVPRNTASYASCAIKLGCPACGERLVQCCGSAHGKQLAVGAQTNISIYKAHVFPNAAEFVACFHGSVRARVADKNNYQDQQFDPEAVIDLSLAEADVNINTCMEFCRGYEYMGVKGGSFCSCGSGPDAIRGEPTAIDPARCDTPCAGGGLKSECAHYGCNSSLLASCNGDGQCCGGDNKIITYKINACSLPSFPAPLYTIPTSSAFVGETIAFACEKGYIVEPANTKWLCNTRKELEGGAVPTCRLGCAVNNSIPFGHVIGPRSTVPIGSSVWFGCFNSSYEIRGERQLKCLPGGVWNHPAPFCAEKCDVYAYDSVLALQQNLCSDCEDYVGDINMEKKYGMRDSYCRANCPYHRTRFERCERKNKIGQPYPRMVQKAGNT